MAGSIIAKGLVQDVIGGTTQPLYIGGVNPNGSDAKLTVNTDGSVSTSTQMTVPSLISSGAINLTGGQIKFPATQVPSADANTLDDYEEGTFTPVFTNFTVGNGGVFGYYTKIGKIVTITYGFNFGSTSAITGSITGMSGLPFVIGAGGPIGGFFSACGHALDNASNFYDLIVIFPAGSTITYDIRRSGTITDISTTYPFTWTNGDALGIICTYLTT